MAMVHPGDLLVKAYSRGWGISSFAKLIDADKPPVMFLGDGPQYDDLCQLADLYDQAQAERGNARRAVRLRG